MSSDTIYTASRTKHAHLWRALRQSGVRVIATWIDESEQGETVDFTDLAQRCIDEAARASRTIIYREHGEQLKGALMEAGAALASGREVVACGEWGDFSCALSHHPNWRFVATVDEALPPADRRGTGETMEETR